MSDDLPPRWDDLREVVYNRDNYRCVNCGSKGGPFGNTELHAHHIVPKSIGGEDIKNKQNLVTLCRDCHNFSHGGQIRSLCDADEFYCKIPFLRRKKNRCQNCGLQSKEAANRNRLHLHFIVPIDKQGKRKKSNVALLCYDCHIKSHT